MSKGGRAKSAPESSLMRKGAIWGGVLVALVIIGQFLDTIKV